MARTTLIDDKDISWAVDSSAVTNSFDDIAAGAAAQIGTARSGPHRNELPLNDDVITFPTQ